MTTGMLLREQTGREPSGLHGWLFDSPTLAAELDDDERERYRRANRYAAKYCSRLSPGVDGAPPPSASCGTSTGCRRPRSSPTSTRTSSADGRRGGSKHRRYP